uniref:Uncharacterized protein n=1 Tax=Mus spicilegus TaxID=10103 RepID=A0A8C6GSB5_MUSSI
IDFPFSPLPKFQRRKHKEECFLYGFQAGGFCPRNLPEVVLIGCSSAPCQQHSRKTDKKVLAPLFAAMVPPVTGGGPSLEGQQQWSRKNKCLQGWTLKLGMVVSTCNCSLWSIHVEGKQTSYQQRPL